jgi:hypothetical protein
MKTYLTREQFADLVFTRFEQRVSQTINPSTGDNVLCMIFRNYPKEVRDAMRGTLWDLDQLGDNVELINVVGPSFHKSFRQTDVTDSAVIDMTIWHCLRDAEIFWQVLGQVSRIMTSEDAAALVLEGDL